MCRKLFFVGLCVGNFCDFDGNFDNFSVGKTRNFNEKSDFNHSKHPYT